MKRSLYILLVFALLTALLPGCDKSGDNPVVAKVGDVSIYKKEVDVKSAASDKMFDSLTGYSEEEIIEKKLQAREAILEELIMEEVLLQKAAEQGIAETPEMLAAAEAGWESTVEAMTEYVLASYPTLEGGELEESVASMLSFQVLDKDTAIESSIYSAIKNELLDRVRQNVAEPDETQIRQAFEELLAEQRERFGSEPEAYEAALLGGDIIAFNPEPCRVVRSVYFKFDEDVIGLIKQLNSVGDVETQAEMREDQFLLMDEKVATAVKRLEEGEAFSVIQAEWPGAAVNYLTENTSRFSDEILFSVWSLDSEGEWTVPIKMEYGYCIYYWSDTLEAGETPFENVREELIELMMQVRRQAAVEDVKALWRGEATIEIYFEKLI